MARRLPQTTLNITRCRRQYATLCETVHVRSRASSRRQKNRTKRSVAAHRDVASRRDRPADHLPPLPSRFLEEYNERNFDPLTHQRTDVVFDPLNGKPATSLDKSNDTPTSTNRLSKDWLETQLKRWRADSNDYDEPWSHHAAQNSAKRVLWTNWTESVVRDPAQSPILFHYDDINKGTDDIEAEILTKLYQYGLVLISGTPASTDTLPLAAMSESSLSVHRWRKSYETAKSAILKLASLVGYRPYETAESAILKLASLVGYRPLQTLYGSGVWSTSSESSFYDDDSGASGSASTADSAYGSTSLPLHTDMTYMTTPPGVQVFLMVQPASTPATRNDEGGVTPKGQSTYLDGFAAARQLFLENPEAFELLASTERTYRCLDDDEGWHMEASGPVIETKPGGVNRWGPVSAIRHNDLDRLPDLPPYYSSLDEVDDVFYHKLTNAHEAWNEILSRESMRLVIDLQPGDCVLVANQRCLHGRYAFDSSASPRVVMGCYVGTDELHSKMRRLQLPVL